jgi:hypothetical protein
MDDSVVNRFELRGCCARELAHRLATLRQAVRAQKGRVLDVAWCPAEGNGLPRATVLYALPLGKLQAAG